MTLHTMTLHDNALLRLDQLVDDLKRIDVDAGPHVPALRRMVLADERSKDPAGAINRLCSDEDIEVRFEPGKVTIGADRPMSPATVEAVLAALNILEQQDHIAGKAST